MPLEYTKPPNSLLDELLDVARHALNLTDELRQVNAPPEIFPKSQVEVICQTLENLPSGTAEGCRVPLEYARLRLASIRREYMQKADEGALEPFARGSKIDNGFALLYTAVGTALDQYRSLAAESEEKQDLVEATVSGPSDHSFIEQSTEAGKKLQTVLDENLDRLSEFGASDSARADDAVRQLNDASGLTRISRNELEMPGIVVGW